MEYDKFELKGGGEEMERSYSIQDIKKLILDWIKRCEETYGEKMMYDVDIYEESGEERIEFRYDADLYQIIEYYFSDGLDDFGLMKEFDNMFKRTGWWFEFERPGIMIIVPE